MAWRLLLRRCPTKSFTVVGDISQATGPASSPSWQDALTPHVGAAWERRDLTINYRTPAQVMESACAMLVASGHQIDPPTSVRAGEPPSFVPIDRVRAVEQLVAEQVKVLGDGRLAVIAPESLQSELAVVMGTWLSASGDLQAPVVLLTPEQTKGLEFDHVIVVDPAGIVAEGLHGARALFVAMTRPTQRLVLAYLDDQLPPGLERIES